MRKWSYVIEAPRGSRRRASAQRTAFRGR